MHWFVSRDGQTFGPFSFDLLVKGVRDGELRRDDFVWSDGMENWALADTIDGLWRSPKLTVPAIALPQETVESERPDPAAPTVVRASTEQPEGDEGTRDRTTTPTKRAGLIRRHWRGELTLAQAYWGVGFLLTIGLFGLAHAFGKTIHALVVSPVGLGIAFGLFLIFLCLCTVWQLTGIWRSAGNHMQTTGRKVWGSLARVAVVLGAIRAVVDFNNVIGPMLLESGRLASRIDTVAAHQLRLLRNGTEVELAGGMPHGTADALKKMLDAAPGVQVVHLNSTGGRVGEGYQIYRLIRDRKLTTYTASHCVSACTIAFLGGAQRLLSTRAQLGFHSISFGGVDQKYIPEINAELRRTLVLHGAPPWFVDKALSTRAKSMWYPTKSELLSAKIVTGVVDPDQFGLSGISNWRDQAALEKGLRAIPLYALVRDHDPDTFKELSDRFAEGVKLGKSTPEIAREMQEVFALEVVPKYTQIAPDDVLRRYWETQVAEIEYLRNNDPASCVPFLFPQLRPNSFNVSKLLPEALMKEDVAALTELVKEAVKNPQVGATIDFEDEVAAVFERISTKSPRAQELLSEPLKYVQEAAALCSAYVVFYRELFVLPEAKSAAMIRVLLR